MLYTTKGTGKVFVKWKEPEFVDNIGIKKIRQTQKNNEYYPPTSFNVLYDAVDVNGNLATCEFTVVIKGRTFSYSSQFAVNTYNIYFVNKCLITS